MSTRPSSVTAVVAGMILIAAVPLTGCGHEAGDHVAAAHDTVAEAAHGAQDAVNELTPAAREAAVARILMAADAVDGTADKVVSNCPGCSLAMEGKAEHATQVGEYELHFCSESCSKHFNANTEASLLALKVPE